MITYQPALTHSEESQEDHVVRSFPSDGFHANEGKHQDNGEGHGSVENSRVCRGESFHWWDEEEPNEGHGDDKLYGEDRVHLQNTYMMGKLWNRRICSLQPPLTFLIKLSLMALSEKLLPIPPYPLSSAPWLWESDMNISSRKKYFK